MDALQFVHGGSMSEQDKNEFVPVPLPFQIPEPPDLSKVPLSVIHSATVETLISQTEDLSARLKVQIRRNAVLERRAIELEETLKTTDKDLQTIRRQQEILQEKDSTHLEKIHTLQTNLEMQKKELDLLETRYSENHALSQRRDEEAKNTQQELQTKIKDLERLLPLEKDNFALQDENSFLKKKIEELCSYLQKKEEEFKDARNLLQLKTENVSQLEQAVSSLQQQVEMNRKAIEEKTELENQLILKEREKEHATSTLSNEVMTHRQELKNLQLITKSMATEKAQLSVQLKTCEETINSLSKDNAELDKQIENLQNLWYKLQAEHEKEKIKSNALTKLNRELSVELQRSKSASNYEEDFLKKYITNGKNIEA
jgi:chromosome segregation ATPase